MASSSRKWAGSLQSNTPAKISNICTIWAQQEVAARIAEGVPIPDLIAGVHKSLAERVVTMVRRLKIEGQVILTGGGGKNEGLHQALSEQLACDILVPSEPLITGALGAALLGKELHEKALKTRTDELEHDPGHSKKSRSDKVKKPFDCL